MTQPSRNKIFISYRHDDDPGTAGRLYDRLEHEFGSERIFRDVHNLTPGSDYRTEIERAIAQSAAMLVVIGHFWLRTGQISAGLREEITTALRSDVVVIPVLLDGAPMPRVAALPPSIHELTYRQAISIRNEQFSLGVAAIVSALEEVIGRCSRPQATAVRPVTRPKRVVEVPAKARTGKWETSVVPVGGEPATPLVAEGSVWVSNRASGSVTVVDPLSHQVRATVAVGREPVTPSVVDRRIWVPNASSGSITIIDPRSLAVIDTIVGLGSRVGRPALLNGMVWVPVSDAGTVKVLDAANGTVLHDIPVGKRPSSVVGDGTCAWVSSYVANTVTAISLDDPASVATLELGRGPETPIMVGDGVWVPVPSKNVVAIIDRRAKRARRQIPVGRWPTALLVRDGEAFVVNTRSNSVSRVDVRSESVVEDLPVDAYPGSPCLWEGRVCVPCRSAGSLLIFEPAKPAPVKVTVGPQPGTPTPGADGTLWVPLTASNALLGLREVV